MKRNNYVRLWAALAAAKDHLAEGVVHAKNVPVDEAEWLTRAYD